jgi:hypothetical protein
MGISSRIVLPSGSSDFLFGASPVLPRPEMPKNHRVAMAGQRITKRVVDSLEIKPSEYAVWDATMPGFGVRVRPTGAISYFDMTEREIARGLRLIADDLERAANPDAAH